jgi:hypothetical protein
LTLKTIADRGNGGATTAELEETLKVDRVSISPRMRPLANRNLIHDSGVRRKGIVWAHGAGLTPNNRTQPAGQKALIKSLVEVCKAAKDLLDQRKQLTLEESAFYHDQLTPVLELARKGNHGRTKEDAPK